MRVPAGSRRSRAALGYSLLGLLAYVPPLLTARGRVAADTKQYLYLDPGRLLSRSVSMWDPHVGMGTVTHQTIGYAFPMGPYYWLLDKVGLPDWVAQRLWLGSLLFVAALGVLYLLRTFGLHGPGVVAALAFMLTPYVLDYAARLSVLLMPWAALPWMIAVIRKALREKGWRYPAIFALIVQVVGGVNATALIFAGVAPVLWILYAWLIAREVDFRRALGVTVRTGALTLLTSLWWIAGLRMQGAYGLDVLKYTETVKAVALTSMPNEVLRGLGYWFFYGQDRLGSWIEAAPDYTQHLLVIAAGYGLVVLSLLAAAFTRWRHRVFFVALLVVGVVISVGSHPYDSPTPLGAFMKAFAKSSTAGLALRSTGRATPLVVLALAILLGLAANAAYRRLRSRGAQVAAWCVPVVLVGLVLVNFPALVDGTYYGKNLQRGENVPQYWSEAIGALDAQSHQTRILEEPGSDFASYTWGNTVDPITPGLTDRPYVARELIPYGTPASAELLNAIDRRLQMGTADPNALAALWRRMGVGDVVARNDIDYARYDLVRPQELAALLGRAPGLERPAGYGTPSQFALPPGYADEISLARTANGTATAVAPVVDYRIQDPTDIVRAESTARGLMVSGDGEGLVDVAGVGLLGGAGVVQYAGAYTSAASLRDATAAGDTLVVTDSNRLRARRWTTVTETTGFTEQAGAKDAPLTDDPGDARLDLFPGEQPSALTTTQQRGVQRVVATAYGNVNTYWPENRPAQALDGDPATSWRTQGFGDARNQRIEVDLDAPITTDHVNLVQPQIVNPNRYVTNVELRFDGGHPVAAALGPASLTTAGQTITFPRRTFRTFTIRVVQTNDHRPSLFGQEDAVGFAEIRLRDERASSDVRVHEVVQMPSDLVDALGAAAATHPLVYVMSRDAIRPVPPRTQPELAISREFTVPEARAFALTGNATISPDAPDAAIEAALRSGAPGRGAHVSGSAFLAGCLACRAAGAFDGDPATSWQTPFVQVRAQWAQVDLTAPVSFDHLDLGVVADGQHSVPTRLRLDVDGATRELTLPPVADAAGRSTPVPVRLDFPTIRGRRIRVTIDDVRAEQTRLFATAATRTEPVSLAEVGIPGVTVPGIAAGPVDSGCRSDLLTIDGKAIAVRIRGAAGDAQTPMGLTVAPCGGPVRLGAGSHTLATAAGRDVAFSIDRLALASGTRAVPLAVRGGHVTRDAAVAPGASSPPAVTVEHDGATKVRVRVSGATDPFWLVLGESRSPGWHARVVRSGDLGASRLVDGYANGWLIAHPPSSSFEVVFEWTPQRQVWAAISLSLLGALLCVAIIATTWFRRRAIATADTALPGDAEVELALAARVPTGRVRWTAPVVAGLLGALLVAPWVGVLVALVVVGVVVAPRLRPFVMAAPAALLGLCALYILVEQVRYRYPSVFEWPTVFPHARTPAWIAVVLLLADAVVEVVWRGRTRAAPPAPASVAETPAAAKSDPSP